MNYQDEKESEIEHEKNILVVDDEESIRYTFDFFLSEHGYSVTGAENYDEAISLIEKSEFDLIFADIVMDGRTGVDLLKMIKEIRPNLPVIMITGVPSV